jgi:hypothetical protein
MGRATPLVEPAVGSICFLEGRDNIPSRINLTLDRNLDVEDGRVLLGSVDIRIANVPRGTQTR